MDMEWITFGVVVIICVTVLVWAWRKDGEDLIDDEESGGTIDPTP